MTKYEFYEGNDGSTSDATIAHYGKKGMRWGVRNDRKSVGGGVRKLGRKLNEGYEKAYLNPRKAEKQRLVEKHRKAGRKRLAKFYEKIPDEGLEIATGKMIGKNAIKGAKMSAEATKRVAKAGKTSYKKVDKWLLDNPGKAVAIGLTVGIAAASMTNFAKPPSFSDPKYFKQR